MNGKAIRQEWSDAVAGVIRWGIHRGIATILIVVGAALVVAAGNRLLRRLGERLSTQDAESGRGGHRAATLMTVLKSVMSVTVWVTAVLLIFNQIGLNLGPLIAGAGIAGLAIGFGAQAMVKDFVTGFFVLLEDQFRVGDTIEIDGAIGVVESFTLRLTSIRTNEGNLVHIGNGEIKKISNASHHGLRPGIEAQSEIAELKEQRDQGG
ncbi:MAG: mechanosensitive ion channel family protein [Actinomycetota bacterium]